MKRFSSPLIYISEKMQIFYSLPFVHQNIGQAMIEKTTDYNIFKKHELNRPINAMNLRRILNSILANNLLEFRPIIINKNFEVVDGQHRLEAAKMLNIPIFYQIQENDENGEDIILLNANQKTWDPVDYLNFYKTKNIEDYKKFDELLKKYESDISFLLRLVGCGTSHAFARFKCGQFKFPEDDTYIHVIFDKIREVSNLIDQKYIGNNRFVKTHTFKFCLLTFLNRKDVFYEVFLSKLENNVQWLRSCSHREYYYEIFKKIYNYKNREAID